MNLFSSIFQSWLELTKNLHLVSQTTTSVSTTELQLDLRQHPGNRDGHSFFNKQIFWERTKFFMKKSVVQKQKTNNEWTKWIVQRNENIFVFLNNDKDRQKRTIENCSNELDKTLVFNEQTNFTKNVEKTIAFY